MHHQTSRKGRMKLFTERGHSNKILRYANAAPSYFTLKSLLSNYIFSQFLPSRLLFSDSRLEENTESYTEPSLFL